MKENNLILFLRFLKVWLIYFISTINLFVYALRNLYTNPLWCVL